MAHRLKDDYDGAYNLATLELERQFFMEKWESFAFANGLPRTALPKNCSGAIFSSSSNFRGFSEILSPLSQNFA